ncbi:protocadherin gamma-A6-like [Pristis pectinata]|uniref:protocadherin gamma-A6-like n=1 Tax=Pristis pectinata TaxID=685728 RepID=UPI00223DAD97|nr:protocadherin gamma-A6-like [Pristis pectinata]
MVAGQIRYSIPEELERGAFVGNVAEDLRLNIGELSTRRCRLVSDDRMQLIEVNRENGNLFVNGRIDREQLCRHSFSCSLSFQIALDDPQEMHRVQLEINDVNDNSPTFAKGEYAFRIIEVIAPGARFPLESAHDPDVGTNRINTYQISPNEHFVLKMQTSRDGSKVAELILEKQLDREQQSVIHLVLTAIDGGTPQRSGTARITVTVMDSNDNAPVFDHEVYKVNVPENAPKGMLVTKVHAHDIDDGTNAQLTYSFTRHTSQTARELFKLEPETGEIRVEGVLDFEESDAYELYVEAVDKGTYPMIGHAKVMVELIDMNDNSPEIEITSISRTVPEDAPIGTVIAGISVRDADSDGNEQIQCEVDGSILFKLQKTSRDNYKLVTNGPLDREFIALYNITISARDRGSSPLVTNRNILVSISDVNDNAPKFTHSSYNVFVSENNVPGVSIFAVTALDPDIDQNGKVSYSLLEYRTKDVPLHHFIMINSKSGNIHALRSFDYEQLKNFQIIVQGQDAGSPSLSSTATVNVIILDQNDNAPIIISPLAWNRSSALEISHHSLYPGYLVAKVIATDADSGQNMRLSYQLLQSTDPGLFTVGLLSGEIRATRSFKDQDSRAQNVVVMVKDHGQPSLSSTTTIFFSIVTNVTDLGRNWPSPYWLDDASVSVHRYLVGQPLFHHSGFKGSLAKLSCVILRESAPLCDFTSNRNCQSAFYGKTDYDSDYNVF